MLLTITTTDSPAMQLGYLLDKHPYRCQSFSLTLGQPQVFYPEANHQRCTAALLLDVDAVKLVQVRGTSLEEYVSDRLNLASSFMSVAIAAKICTKNPKTCKFDLELKIIKLEERL